MDINKRIIDMADELVEKKERGTTKRRKKRGGEPENITKIA